MSRILFCIILSLNIAFAQNSVKLNTGDLAPFPGHLVKKERLEKLIKAEKSNIVLKDLRLTQEQLTEYHRPDANTQRQKLSTAKFDSNIKAIGMFIVGSILTALTFKINDKVGDI